MTIDLVFKNLVSKKPQEDFFRRIFEKSAEILKLKSKKIEMGLFLMGEGKIKKMNKKYRNRNKATDVLSFPVNEKLKIACSPKPRRKRGNWETCPEYVEGLEIMPLGDIFICPAIAKRRAKEENITITEKFGWLAVHGFLHLAGYDHEKSDREAGRMLELENRILRSLKS